MPRCSDSATSPARRWNSLRSFSSWRFCSSSSPRSLDPLAVTDPWSRAESLCVAQLVAGSDGIAHRSIPRCDVVSLTWLPYQRCPVLDTSGLKNALRAIGWDTDKSMRCLCWVAANERRAASRHDEEFKTLLLRIAAQYHDLALQIDDPAQWRAPSTSSPAELD
jgi:hypothetical protein